MDPVKIPRDIIDMGWRVLSIRPHPHFDEQVVVKIQKHDTKLEGDGFTKEHHYNVFANLRQQIDGIPLDNWAHLAPAVTMPLPVWTRFTDSLPADYSGIIRDDIRLNGAIVTDDELPAGDDPHSVVTFSHGVILVKKDPPTRLPLVETAQAWLRAQQEHTLHISVSPENREKVLAAIKKAGGRAI